MSNESQVEAETTTEPADGAVSEGGKTPLAALLDSPLGLVLGMIVAGVVIGVAVFFAAGGDDAADGLELEPRAVGEWRDYIDSGAIAATYDGTDLSWAELEGMLERLPAGAPIYDGVPDIETAGQVVRQWAVTVALDQELATRGVDVTAFDRQDALDETLLADPSFDETTPYGALALSTRTLTVALDRSVAEQAADSDVELPEYLCASHILVETGEEAQEIIELLDGGADFATLAIERSADGSAAIGGDLGCGPTIGYVPEFSDGAREAGNGNLSGPVRSQFGWHVISVRTIGELNAANHPEMTQQEIDQALGSFEPQARDRIANELGNEIVDAAWERVSAGLTLDDRIGIWDANLRIIAPPDRVGQG
ncbi:MAG: peptidylprolyl isomerase [Actinomycetota bacterium]